MRTYFKNTWNILRILVLAISSTGKIGLTQASSECAFHTIDGVKSESEGSRFMRLREDTEVGKEILALRAYPRSTIALRSADGTDDYKFFKLNELNSTTVTISLARTLENLVDSEEPQNLLKFRIACAGKREKLDKGNYLSITVYIEDVNDNAPEFQNTPYIANVYENTPPGTVVLNVIQAIDRDKPNTPNSEVYYSLSSEPEQLADDGSPYFTLKSPHQPYVILKHELDFDYGIRLFLLTVHARDRGTPAHQVNTSLSINVLDVDDLPPKFTEGVYRTKIYEFFPMKGSPIRVPLYFQPPIMAYDMDTLNATLEYNFISGNERQLFWVNPNNSILYLQKEIDLEEESLPANTFVLQIEARQRDNPLRKALARIEIEILDLNDNAPEFEADFYNISIVENLPTGFSVLQVNAVDRDQGENADFMYQLQEQADAIGAFRIDSRSGWITVRDDSLLDREKRRAIHMEVRALEKMPPYRGKNQNNKKREDEHSTVKVEITLLDTNDNTPKFEQGNLYEFKVAQWSPVGYKVGQVKAKDPDEGPNGLILYELQRPKGSGYIPFSLDTKNGTIFVNGPLRRGRLAVFVEASDQPTNPAERRFSLAVITIEVYSANDEQSIDFVGAPYEFWVGVNAPLGTSVGQVRTTLTYNDEDEVMYDLLHTYSEGVPFAIEERSGIITVIRELKDFVRKIYHFEAVANYLFSNTSHPVGTPRMEHAVDAANPMVPEIVDEGVLITNVTIHVVAKPESKSPTGPVIEEINMNIIVFHIEENLVGGIIGQLLYKDGINVVNNDLPSYRESKRSSNISTDSFHLRSKYQRKRTRASRKLAGDVTTKLRYIIANQQEVANKITITEDGTLLTLTGLDREQRDSYDLTIIVEYSTGLISGAGIYQANVKVDDVNDCVPKFNAPIYIGLIYENSRSGKELILSQPIRVTDADEGFNAEFRIILQGDNSEEFTIISHNESNPVRNKMTNENDISLNEAFEFFNLTDEWSDQLKFFEMQSIFVHTQSVEKQMDGKFFRIMYTGKQPIDREKYQSYSFKLIAVDSGGLSSSANLNIFVADVNDNAPMFERIFVFKDAKIEIREYTSDMEIYFVESSSPMPQAIQSQSAVVMPPYHIPGSPRLHSGKAKGYGSDLLNSMRKLRYAPRTHVSPSNRSTRAAPHNIHLKCPLLAIFEDIPLTTKVLQVMAIDEDLGKNADIYYEIKSEHVERASGVSYPKVHGVRHFSIDKLSGELLINYPLTSNTEIFLNVSATDTGGLQDTTCLRFTVIDVNDHAPTFSKTWYSFDAKEGSYNDSVLGRVIAIDLDYGQNANITYTLNTLDIPFQIKPSSGVIKINGELDRELHPKYNFQVVATDNAEPLYKLSSSVDVEVNILDVNDNKPEFIAYDDLMKIDSNTNNIKNKSVTLPIYKVFLDRSALPGVFVKQVTAIDKDDAGNGNGLVLYSLNNQGKDTPMFQIDSRDGTIKTLTKLDNYKYEHINVTVVASDMGSPTQSSTAMMLINLQGQNVTENGTDKSIANITSLFETQYYEVQIPENNIAPTEIVQINFTSAAKGEFFSWHLILENNAHKTKVNSLFLMNGKTRTLYALRSFDREQIERYQLRIRADTNITTRESRSHAKVFYPVIDERVQGLEFNECRIIIQVLDENDNAPVFRGNGQPVIAAVPRFASFGYPVTTVVATDIDKGLNAEIRYRLLNERSRLFNIDEVTGRIRLVGSVPLEERVYGFDVKATDRNGADDGHSSITNVFVYVIDESKQVRIILAGKPVEIEQKIDSVTRELSNLLQVDVRVRLLEPHVGGAEPATDAYIYAVDYRNNALMEMDQLQMALEALQLNSLQFPKLQHEYLGDRLDSNRVMPRIIGLAELGQSKQSHTHQPSFLGKSAIFIVLIVICGVMILTMLCLCSRCRKRRNSWTWSHKEASKTGLTYSIARAAEIEATSPNYYHKGIKTNPMMKTKNSSIPEVVYSSESTQSTTAHPTMSEQPVLHRHHHLQPHHHHQQLQYMPQQKNNNKSNHQQQQQQQHREYIDVPLPKSVTKPAVGRCLSLEPELISSPFMLKYKANQPLNNLRSATMSDNSMFSLDSGVDFLSSRELNDTAPNSLNISQVPDRCTYGHSPLTDLMCPKHANKHAGSRHCSHANDHNNANATTESSEDSMKNADSLVAFNCRKSSDSVCSHRRSHHHTKHENRLRRSFSGVNLQDDLLQNSPRISLRSRGHVLRNSMTDLEERLRNLEQSFCQSFDLKKQ